ncbi:cupin domain-containing protein [Notoacmeibacter ruber]|uniref:Cupin n=1 Tax=Notoacmeibacter ruber TaxID=2670375 RepID=A0A3L7JC33_9HYPH|nr:cupin domain-containing protein [Notoacmeibacter ruber]RLQ88196.1 cupin [Notoacmeibacter ruber]
MNDSTDCIRLNANGGIPNNPDHPARIYVNAIDASGGSSAVRRLLEKNGWTGTWTWQVYDFHHYHPDAWEALGVAEGSAKLIIGGPEGRSIDVRAGDLLLVPPGWGHCQLSASEDFTICGAYPPGQENFSLIKADQSYDDAILRQIATVSLPKTDPVSGESFVAD